MSDDIRVEEGVEVDLAQLATLFQAVGFARDPASLGALVAGSTWVVSAWDGDRLVGFGRALSDRVSNAYISSVGVLPSHQRRGIGRRLIERLLAGRDGVKFVLTTSHAGEPLYRSLGFVDAPNVLVRPRSG